jgi:phosphopantetheinyl transferase (holo-ACP synthase)
MKTDVEELRVSPWHAVLEAHYPYIEGVASTSLHEVMPVRPFPYPFRIGIDLQFIPRITRIIAGENRDNGGQLTNGKKLHRFATKLCTPCERSLFYAGLTKGQSLRGYGDHVNWAANWLASRYVTTIVQARNWGCGWIINVNSHCRWAAKEATIKAVQPRRITFQDIVVLKQESGEPYALVLDTMSKAKQEKIYSEWVEKAGIGQDMDEKSLRDSVEAFDGQIARLSISHDNNFVTSVCLALSQPATDDVGGEAQAREEA